MTATRTLCPPMTQITRPALGLVAVFAFLLAAWSATADVVKTVDGEQLGGSLTLDKGQDTAKLTDKAGRSKTLKLIDIDEIRFGEDLAVIQSGDRLLIDNDKGQISTRKDGKIKLRAGLHRIVIPYWQAQGDYSISVTVSGPGVSGAPQLGSKHLRCFRMSDDKFKPSEGFDAEGFRMPELSLKDADNRRRFLSRSRYRLYNGNDSMAFTDVGVIGKMQFKRSGTTTAIDTGVVNDQRTHFGIVFEAFFKAEKDGEYTFILTNDDGAQLYFGDVGKFRSGMMGQGVLPTSWRAELAHGGKALGELKSLADNKLVMHLPMISDAEFSLSHVRSFWDSRVDASKIDRSSEQEGTDTAYIRDKEKPDQIVTISGKVVALTKESLTFVYLDKERTINFDRVAGLAFGHKSRPAPEQPGFFHLVQFRGGHALPCKIESIGERVFFDVIGGTRLTCPRKALFAMRSENGRRIDLTRIEPTAEEAIPYFKLAMPHRVNESFTGSKIKLYNNKSYERGLAVHSKSRLHYKLDRPCEQFTATFGLLAPGGELGNVTARVLGDDKVLWEKKDITAQTVPVEIRVALKGVKRLVLEVDFGQGQNVGDRSAWCNPQLIFASPQ